MDLEARVKVLEAEMTALRNRLDSLVGPSGKAAAAAVSGTANRLLHSIAEKVREASLDLQGHGRPLVLQAVVDHRGSTYISMSTQEELLHDVDTAAILQLASTLASEVRLKILRSLADGERSAAEIAAAAGLEGGPLYHHLSELNEGGFLSQPSRGRYAMTRRGKDLYYQAALLVRTPYDQLPEETGTTSSDK